MALDGEDAQTLMIRCPVCAAGPDAACRELQDLAARGDLATAYTRLAQLAAAWRQQGGPDLSSPATARAGDAARFSCLPLVLQLRASFAALAPDTPPEIALAWSEAAFLAAPPGTQGAAQARRDMAAAARVLAPEIGAELLAGMAGPDVPPPGTAQTLAEIFVQTMVQGRGYEAAQVEPLLDETGLPPRLAADTLFCRGILALNLRVQPAQALEFFERGAAFCATHPDLAVHEAMAREHAALARSHVSSPAET